MSERRCEVPRALRLPSPVGLPSGVTWNSPHHAVQTPNSNQSGITKRVLNCGSRGALRRTLRSRTMTAPALALKASYRSKKVREWLPTSTTKQLAMLWIGHLVLGVALRHTGRLGLAHALITLFAGLFLALQARKAVTVAYVAAYIVGSEVLWRMAGAGLVWEIAKYELVVISVWTMFRLRQRRIPWAPVFYIMLQLPAAVLTYGYMSFSPYFRKAAMFTFRGPWRLPRRPASSSASKSRAKNCGASFCCLRPPR